MNVFSKYQLIRYCLKPLYKHVQCIQYIHICISSISLKSSGWRYIVWLSLAYYCRLKTSCKCDLFIIWKLYETLFTIINEFKGHKVSQQLLLLNAKKIQHLADCTRLQTAYVLSLVIRIKYFMTLTYVNISCIYAREYAKNYLKFYLQHNIMSNKV